MLTGLTLPPLVAGLTVDRLHPELWVGSVTPKLSVLIGKIESRGPRTVFVGAVR